MLNQAVVDLELIKFNAKEIRKKLNKKTKFYAVVKADAYGHGANVVSSALYPIVDGFIVALVEEGISLRWSGIDKEILVLIPPVLCDIENCLRNGLTMTVDSVKLLKEIVKTSNKLDVSPKIHIKYNVGMNRLGASDIELKKILEYAKSEHVEILGFYSHLPAPENDKITNEMLNKFLLAKRLVKEYNKKVVCHISASGGFIKGIHLDLVRIGILLYGYKPFNTDYINVKPALKVYAPVVCNKRLRKNDLCLYGDVGVDKGRDISILRVGYADGFLRNKSGDLINNRCMDLSAYKKCKEDMVCVLSNAEELAKKQNTISYEILVNATKRAKIIYKR